MRPAYTRIGAGARSPAGARACLPAASDVRSPRGAATAAAVSTPAVWPGHPSGSRSPGRGGFCWKALRPGDSAPREQAPAAWLRPTLLRCSADWWCLAPFTCGVSVRSSSPSLRRRGSPAPGQIAPSKPHAPAWRNRACYRGAKKSTAPAMVLAASARAPGCRLRLCLRPLLLPGGAAAEATSGPQRELAVESRSLLSA